jgi:hypothetical protein
MKVLLIVSACVCSNFSTLMAKDLSPYEDTYVATMNADYKEANFNQEMKVTNLTKLLDQQQKSYEDKIAFLETELRKTKDRLIEKSMYQEKIEDAMKDKYSAETLVLKKELAYKIKSLLDYQRQIEKMKPTEDLKNMIKLNTELASELRRSEDQLAIVQLKQVESMQNDRSNIRMPASVNEGSKKH